MLCNRVQREGVKVSSDLISGLFCYVQLVHDIWYSINRFSDLSVSYISKHGRSYYFQEVKLFYHMVELEWDSPRTRQWAVEASTPLLPHGQHQPSAIWQLGSVCIHFSTEVLQIPSHSSMIERGEVEPHLGFRGGDPPAQLEERCQAFPPTGLITFPKVVISDPHAQIGESDLQQRHDLIFAVIQFLHFAFACSKLFLLAKDES